jgi:N-acetylneuraminate synthase
MKSVYIGKRLVGPGQPPLVIAEVGINHEGSYRKAIQCVDAAAAAGAECIKFQCHITEAEMIPADIKPRNASGERLWDIIKRCELTEKEERSVKEYCRQKDIMYLSTPFSREAADRLNAMGVEAFKVGSGECNNYPLIDHIAAKKKPVILSTGMNDIKSIKKSVSIIKKNGCPLILMHCTSMYPTPYEKVRLGAIEELMNIFNVPVGLSDHSMGIYTCLGAVVTGASLLEKHFTVTRSWTGPDIPISIEPQELTELIRGSYAIFLAMNGRKSILPEEKPVIDFAYASIVSICDIPKNTVFSTDNIWVKRPGTGIPAMDLSKIMGKRAKKNIKANSLISRSDIKG